MLLSLVHHANGGGYQQNAGSHQTGDGNGFQTTVGKGGHFALENMADGVIQTGAGDQADQAQDQIADGRAFAAAGHHFGINGCENGSQQHSAHFGNTGLDQQAVHDPGEDTAGGAEQNAQIMDIEQEAEANCANAAGNAFNEQAMVQHGAADRCAP